jgi:hypothetical protein
MMRWFHCKVMPRLAFGKLTLSVLWIGLKDPEKGRRNYIKVGKYFENRDILLGRNRSE